VPCVVVETWPKEALLYEYGLSEEQAENPCALEGRSEVNPLTRRYIEDQLRQSGRCGGTSEISCDDYHVCALDQLEGAAADACQTDPDVEDSGLPGFCYVDPSATNEQGEYVAGGGVNGGNRLVANCPASERRLLRFVGKDTPLPRSVTLIACQTEELRSKSDLEPEDFARILPFIEPEHGTSEIPPSVAPSETSDWFTVLASAEPPPFGSTLLCVRNISTPAPALT
jgi:hypothetical protein